MIDIHSHILWCMDDGPESMEESLAMASIAAEEGVSTSHPHCIDEKDLTGFAQGWRKSVNSLIRHWTGRDTFKVIPERKSIWILISWSARP